VVSTDEKIFRSGPRRTVFCNSNCGQTIHDGLDSALRCRSRIWMGLRVAGSFLWKTDDGRRMPVPAFGPGETVPTLRSMVVAAMFLVRRVVLVQLMFFFPKISRFLHCTRGRLRSRHIVGVFYSANSLVKFCEDIRSQICLLRCQGVGNAFWNNETQSLPLLPYVCVKGPGEPPFTFPITATSSTTTH
jgi:hypothetical protein